jgi:hypothetical protein
MTYFIVDTEGKQISSPIPTIKQASDIAADIGGAQIVAACECCDSRPASPSSDLCICFDCQISGGI